MAHDVFISHSTVDKAIGDAVCATLEQRGIRCWIAPRDVQPGEEWGKSIIQGIKGCRILVLILSSAANTSPHILREVERAIHWGKMVVPLRIEETLPEGALEFHLSAVHWLDALTPPLERHLQRLAETLLRILDRATPGADGAVAADVRPEPATAAGGSAPTAQKDSFSLAHTLKGYDGSPVHSIAFSPDGTHLVTGTKGGVTLWEVVSRRKRGNLGRQTGPVSTVAFCPDGKWVASGDHGGAVELYNVPGARSVSLGRKGLLSRLVSLRVLSVAFSPDGQRLAAGGEDALVRVWDVPSAREVLRLERHKVFAGGIVVSVAFSPDGRLLASAGYGGIRVWDPEQGRELRSFDDLSHMDGLSLAFSPDSRLLACLGRDGQIRLLDPNGRRETRILNPDAWESVRTDRELLEAAGGGLAFDPAGALITSAGERSLNVWDLASGELVWSKACAAVLSCVAFSPDGRTLAAGGYDGKVRLWSVGENE